MLRRHRVRARPGEGGFSLPHQQEVLEFVCGDSRCQRKLTSRMAWQLATARRHDRDWETTWKEKLMPNVQWPALILPDETLLLISPRMRWATESNTTTAPHSIDRHRQVRPSQNMRHCRSQSRPRQSRQDPAQVPDPAGEADL
jgi:hypothetical protein